MTRERADEFNLRTAPAKKSDRRAFEGSTVQAEALPPDVLQKLLALALEANFDRDVLNARQAAFEGQRATMAYGWEGST